MAPRSKLATARGLSQDTLGHGLGEAFALGEVDEDELYEAMDWLLKRQPRIERGLAERHLEDGALVLYDVTSTWLEGRCCPLARHGYSRDGKRGKLQIVFGLLCNAQGCPVAVEVFEGNTADPATLGTQIDKLRRRFRLSRVVLVGDHGMLTEARIREEVKPAGLEWITALRAPAIRGLASGGTVQLSLFDERALAEIHHRDFPGERLIACRNPLLAEERARKREALLQATEDDLDRIGAATRRDKRRLVGKDKIGLRVGKVIGKHKVGKHFDLEIAEEAALDGLYVIRTSLSERELGAQDTVRAYKGLSRIERAFRTVKTVDLKVRPIHHYRPERVRAHVLLCMLAYHVEWHMRQRLASILFDEDDPAGARRRARLHRRTGNAFGPAQGRRQAHTRRRAGCTASAPSSKTWRPSPGTEFSLAAGDMSSANVGDQKRLTPATAAQSAERPVFRNFMVSHYKAEIRSPCIARPLKAFNASWSSCFLFSKRLSRFSASIKSFLSEVSPRIHRLHFACIQYTRNNRNFGSHGLQYSNGAATSRNRKTQTFTHPRIALAFPMILIADAHSDTPTLSFQYSNLLE